MPTPTRIMACDWWSGSPHKFPKCADDMGTILAAYGAHCAQEAEAERDKINGEAHRAIGLLNLAELERDAALALVGEMRKTIDIERLKDLVDGLQDGLASAFLACEDLSEEDRLESARVMRSNIFSAKVELEDLIGHLATPATPREEIVKAALEMADELDSWARDAIPADVLLNVIDDALTVYRELRAKEGK